MKWIGQHIYDLVARFRNDVYLHNIQSGTIASGGNLGLDSNNKIVKATETTGDITGVALTASTGIDLTSVANATGGDYAATIGVDVSDFMTNGSDNRVLTATGTDAMNAEANLTFDGSSFALTGAYDQAGDTLKVVSTSGSSNFPSLQLHSNHNSTSCSALEFFKDRGAAQVNGDRIGIINWYGEDASQNIQQYAEVRVTADNTTHGSERGSFRVSVAEYDGTVTEGFKVEGSASNGIVNTYIGAGSTSITTINGAMYFGETQAIDSSGLIKIASQTGITTLANVSTVGTITTGVWQGTAIASAYLDSDTAHLSGIQTFSGAKTFSATTTTFTSATADSPLVKILNTTDDDQAGRLMFEKLRADDGVAHGQNLGEIWFTGQDSAQNTEDYAAIIGEIDVSTNGQESGLLSCYVASHDGGNNRGLLLQGGSVDNEVDVTIGAGAASVTKVSGTLTMGTTAFVDNSGVIQVATQGNINHDSLAGFEADEHLDWTQEIEEVVVHAANIPTLNQNTTGNAATATTAAALTSGDKTIEGNLRIGGSGDTSNNWITIDAQNGTDTTGGGICFYETGTDTIGAPQYGAKIVYNEDDDEFAIGTMHNNSFMRQIYMRRGFDYVYFGDAAFVEGTTPTLGFSDTSTTVADTDVLGILYWTNSDDGGTTARIQAVATENHASGANGGTKIEFKTTPNTTSAEVTALTIGQDQSLTTAGSIELGHASDTTIARSASGVATIEGNIIQTRNKVIHLEQGTLSDDIGTTEHFFPAVTTAESTAFANVVTPMLMPVAGKLLKVHIKSNNDLDGSSNEITFKLYAAGTDDRWNEGDKSLLGTKVITGGVKRDVMIADFQDLTTTGASGTNAFTAGDLIGISIQNSQAQGTTHKIVWTFVFELDFNSY
mgnify:CR=1 FL=1